MNSKSNAQAMETEKISRLLARLAIPAVVAQIINLLYNIVDRIYIGHIPGVGAAALTASILFTGFAGVFRFFVCEALIIKHKPPQAT